MGANESKPAPETPNTEVYPRRTRQTRGTSTLEPLAPSAVNVEVVPGPDELQSIEENRGSPVIGVSVGTQVSSDESSTGSTLSTQAQPPSPREAYELDDSDSEDSSQDSTSSAPVVGSKSLGSSSSSSSFSSLCYTKSLPVMLHPTERDKPGCSKSESGIDPDAVEGSQELIAEIDIGDHLDVEPDIFHGSSGTISLTRTRSGEILRRASDKIPKRSSDTDAGSAVESKRRRTD